MTEAEAASVLPNLERLFVSIIDSAEEDFDEFFLTRSREGLFSCALTIWLMICQRTQGRQSLLGALECLNGGECQEILSRNSYSRRAKRKEVSLRTGGLSKARERLKLSEVESVAKLISERLIRQQSGEGLWHGRRVYLMDGTRIALAYSKKNQDKYPPTHNQHRASHTSELLCLCFHELFSGIALSPCYGPYRGSKATSEQALCKQMLARVPEPGLMLGDCNFGTFAICYTAAQHKHEVLVRLTRTRAHQILGTRETPKKLDQSVAWSITSGAQENNLEIPVGATLEGRVIKSTIKNPNCKPLELFFFTNSTQSAQELVALYKKREHIENDIRSIKYALNMEMLHAKSPAMLEKELILGIAAYNLMRSVLATAARRLKLQPREISFSRACALIQIAGNNIRRANSKQEEKDIIERLLIGLRQSTLPKRKKQRVEPRQIVRKRKLFPFMKTSRAQAAEKAEKCLEEYGHRGYYTTVTRKY